MNIVIGGRGRLGSALAAAMAPTELVVPDRSVYADWWRPGAETEVARYLEAHCGDQGAVFVAAGLLNPTLAGDDLDQVNYLLARHVVLGAEMVGLSAVSFGTVMEGIVGQDAANPYVASKIRLGRFMAEHAAQGGRSLHVRIHTLYGGGAPEPFMFLGQMYQALRSRSEFRMSSGEQLREYHHVDDDVRAIRTLVDAGVTGVIDLNHGRPLPLKDIARHVFDELGVPHLLQVGALAGPAVDNFGLHFSATAGVAAANWRETLPGIVQYLRGCTETDAK